MENIIRYYYNLNITNYQERKDAIIIEANEMLYIARYIKDSENFNRILGLIYNIPNEFYKPVITKDSKYYFEYNGKSYTLFEVKAPSFLRSNEFVFLASGDQPRDYTEVWSNNIEYYIKQLITMETRDWEKIDYLNYYIGMAENAIALNERAKKMNGNARVVVSHYRIRYPNYDLTYNDPTELTIDYIPRDLAEYVKSKFFEQQITIEETLELIYKYELNDKELLYFFSRLLYPNYYFDLINAEKSECLEKYLRKRKEYELFLRETIAISQKNQTINIAWLSR